MIYEFAVNRLKVTQAVDALKAKKKLDPSIEINDDTVREEYVKRGGLVREKAAKDEDEEVEETTAGKRKTSRKAKDEDEE